MLFKKKKKIPKFFDGTTWAEKYLEDHIIQSTQCLDLSHSLSSLLTWPLNIYFWNGFTNCYDWLKDSSKMCILLNTCWMVVGFNKTKQQKKQTTCLILHEVTDLYKTKCCFIKSCARCLNSQYIFRVTIILAANSSTNISNMRDVTIIFFQQPSFGGFYFVLVFNVLPLCFCLDNYCV